MSENPKRSPQQLKPIIPKSTPRNAKGQIVNQKNQPVGSQNLQFYENTQDNPKALLYAELEEKIQTFRARGRLWATEEEDPEVAEILKQYDELQKELHPQLSDALSFHDEEWNEEGEQDE